MPMVHERTAMTSTRYIGYLGGAAIAAGVGAAIAVAGAATANAETPDSEAGAAQAKTETKPDRPKPLQELTDRIEKVATEVTKKASTTKAPSISKPTEANISATQITVRKPTAKEFEAEQVERLKGLFQGESTAPAAKNNDNAITAAAEIPYEPNPFRADDPAPVDVPDAVVGVSEQLQTAVGPDLAPYVREGVEQAYRGSQMVPWVNAVVPITKILPSIGPAAAGDTAARQLIVNELIKTTPPGSFLYYGYDLVADLANRENEAQALKEQAFTGVWDLLDPTGILHPPGQPGIGGALG
jgi:hypothetical protein